jgi:hypothetical protein
VLNVQYACKSWWAHPTELVGDVGQLEAPFSLFGYSVNLSVRYVHGSHRMCHRLGNHFGCTQWYSYVTCVKWKLIFVNLEIVLILTQDRYTVCDEHAIGSKIVLGAPDGTPRCRGLSGSSFWPISR